MQIMQVLPKITANILADRSKQEMLILFCYVCIYVCVCVSYVCLFAEDSIAPLCLCVYLRFVECAMIEVMVCRLHHKLCLRVFFLSHRFDIEFFYFIYIDHTKRNTDTFTHCHIYTHREIRLGPTIIVTRSNMLLRLKLATASEPINHIYIV